MSGEFWPALAGALWHALAGTLVPALAGTLIALAAGVGACALLLRQRALLGALRRSIERAAGGDLFEPVSAPRRGQIGALVRTFNHMLERVRVTHAELEATNRNLEAIVEERTLELRRSERKYRSLVGQAGVGILLWEPAGGRIVEANARAAELLAERPRDLLGRPIEQIFPEAERARAQRELGRVREVGSLQLEEIWVERRGRPPFPAQLGASLVRLGEEALVLGILQDLTEKKELERRAALSHARLRRSEKLASLGQLAAGVAHELNNPMGYVASNVNRLVEFAGTLSRLVHRAPGDATAAANLAEIDAVVSELEEIAEEASEGVARVTEIVRALREFSYGSPDEGQKHTVDLNNVVRNCLTLVHNELQRAEVRLELSALPAVRCHPTQIAQVVVALLRNALQAVAEGGTIRVETFPAGERVQIAVEDDGCGIAPAQLPLIFDPFFTTRGVGQGTGLGLAVSRELVRAHGGEIWVDTERGRGSRFVVELPVDGSEAGEGTRPESS